MIVWASLALAAYEAWAFIAGKPKVTDLSHRKHTAPFVWGWFFWLGLHFWLEARRERTKASRSSDGRPLR